MHVLFISEYYPPIIKGGGEINLSTLAKALAQHNHTVAVLTSSFPELPPYQEQEGVEIYRRLKTGENPGSLRSNIIRGFLFPFSVKKETSKIVREINPGLIHFIGTSIIAAPKLKSLQKPLFATIESYPTLCPKGDRWYHGKEECKITCTFTEFASCQKDSDEIGKMKNRWYLKYNPFFLAYTYNYYKKLNKALSYCTLISISRYVQQLLALHGHQSRAIPNILEADALASPEKNISAGKVKILYLGSLIKSKGPQILLEALKGMECRYHCDLYGEGNLKPELQKIIAENKLDAEIHPPVPYEKIPELYSAADIVVFPSLWPEPFGRIAIEAMAAGKIIIGSRAGAIEETILPLSGTLVKPGDIIGLKQAIEENSKKIIKLRAGAGPLQKYSQQEVTTKLIRRYREILEYG